MFERRSAPGVLAAVVAVSVLLTAIGAIRGFGRGPPERPTAGQPPRCPESVFLGQWAA